MFDNPPLFILGPNLVKQLGAHDNCAHEGCTVKNTSWRVLLGQWSVQVYVCTSHLSWGCALDMVSDDHGKAHGWAQVPIVNGARTMRPTQVVPALPIIKRLDFKRELDIGESYPQTVTTNDGRLLHTWSKSHSVGEGSP